MSRNLRPHQPRAVFHLTARTHFKEPWFHQGGLCEPVASIINVGVHSSDARLMAFTVMSNHFHIVLQQGRQPLGRVMQPILRRIALLVQRRFGFEGYIFERRYRSSYCDSALYLRRSIVYTHINPQRGGLCAPREVYPWTSHARYLEPEGVGVSAIDVAYILPLFASGPNRSYEQLQEDYLRHVYWRLEKDEHDKAGVPYEVPEPAAPAGDEYFHEQFVSGGPGRRPPLSDLRDRAIEILRRIDPQANLESLRGAYGSRRTTRVRNQLIAGLLQAGYRCKNIADYMRISDSTVSAIAGRMRSVTN